MRIDIYPLLAWMQHARAESIMKEDQQEPTGVQDEDLFP